MVVDLLNFVLVVTLEPPFSSVYQPTKINPSLLGVGRFSILVPDFIFSVIGEEGGYLFAQLTILFYFLFIWRALVIARTSRDRYGSFVATGIAAMFAFYSIINIGMVMGCMPITGLPLPLLSYGGSSMLSSIIAIGVLLSIKMRSYK